MNKKECNDDINVIINKVKTDVRDGVAGKNMTITDISLKMTAAFNEIREAFTKEIEKVIQEEQDTNATSCPECGNALKKTEN